MPRIYLGKILLRWCDACHAPVMAETCACGAATRPVSVTPPGDARPAFPDDIDRINRIYQEYFGAPLIPDGHLALLNKVPSDDRMDEIVMGGAVVGAVRYLPAEDRWEPLPRPHAAAYMTPAKRYVVVDDGAVPSIRDEGASLLAPGLVAIDPAVAVGDEVFILTRGGECIGVGRAKASAADTEGMERGTVIRTRKNFPATCVPGEATWDTAVAANADILEKFERSAVEFVRDVIDKNPAIQPTVSYSGGKDSLATLLVVLEAIGKVPLIFADTGLEFPETYENIDDVAECYDLPVIRINESANFWKTFDEQGPPAVDFRWCCKVCKLHPVAHLIDEHWGECLSFIGQRKYESVKRMQSRRVWRNSHVRNQLSAAPIQTWTAMHVWLYIFQKQAPYNRLYEQGLDRIGCFMCPSSDMATLQMIEETCPDLWADWTERLRGWQERQELPSAWVDDGLWRRRGGQDEEDSYN
ncbi:phosphoadenosine phosphosulfate reductase [Methanoculleus taiwanensis]|uniref:Phosphoadenosine phosphosulfate reductase n=1 Tax=Methanoculleus taiwanensis TaxID=1550565 RepID=A0A498H272_9EURY|nr:phosphoadenosine phosphosulfate reductase family protein [Methanoculleus taiwanensis]RXE56200.1 phosphoadenosine phosphosulfate reductase [Methanoculleus taiwanensis]